jgi:anaphase-promoting complex subunit 2
LDPLGSILHEIATPIRQYVRARSDTIRLIVDNLVREEDSLIDADEPVVPLQSAQAQDYTDENWTPEPKDAAPGMAATWSETA